MKLHDLLTVSVDSTEKRITVVVAELLQGVDDFVHGYCLSMARVIESYDSMYRCNRQ